MENRRIGAILKTLLFTIIVPGSVVLLVPFLILPNDSHAVYGPLGICAVVVLIAGAAICLHAAWEFAYRGLGTPAPIDPPKVLVVRGPNAIVRNPMYVGVTAIVLGEAMLFRSRELLLYAACLWLAFHLFVVLYEEPKLTEQFGDAYGKYRRTVPRWIPRLPTRPPR